jgi:radical SAM protein with 4Fe4S-binding SPASM domain
VKQISYKTFWSRIHSNADKRSIPLRVMFELTYDCNFKCRHCYVPRAFQARYRKRQLKTKQVFRVLDQLKDSGSLYLGFTGGEPFKRADIFPILEYSRKLGFQVIIYTNGSFLDEKAVRKLALIRPNKVDITLPGISQSVFENITGVAGSHKAVFKAIELLHQKGIPLGFKSCFLEENAKEIKAIKRFATSMKAQHRLDTLLSCRLDGSPKPYQFRGELSSKMPLKAPLNSEFKGCLKENKDKDVLFFCGAGNSQAAITPAGELKLCLMISEPKYSILRSTFTKAWLQIQRKARGINRDKNYSCPSCFLQEYCSWCPARGWLYNKSFTSCDPQAREWAQRTKEEYAS